MPDAEAGGRLNPGATIVGGTAGNTGIGLAVIGRARGYRTVIVIPNNQSPEKMHLLRTLGAEVKAVPESHTRIRKTTIISRVASRRSAASSGRTNSITRLIATPIIAAPALKFGSKRR